MRSVIPASLLCALLGSAVVPLAAAEPQDPVPPVCLERELSGGVVSAGVDSCRQDHETSGCSNGSAQRIHHYEQVGPVWVQVHYCFPHMPPP